MDCVVSYRLSSLRSGVAKFNSILARRFNVPLYGIHDNSILQHRQPLLSLKVSELTEQEISALAEMVAQIRQCGSLHLFLHSFSGTPIELEMIQQAEVVYCGNSQVYSEVSQITPKAVELWSPATILDTQRFEQTQISVFSFGMAHKIRVELYRKLRALLEDTGKSYSLIASTAFHESVSFDDSSQVFERLQKIFGRHLYFMGFLSDPAVYNYLVDTTFFAAFFDQGVRANNSTVIAAMQYGSVVITNLDAHSPPSFVHLDNLLDIHQCRALPTDSNVLAQISARAKETARAFDWDALIARMSERSASLPPLG